MLIITRPSEDPLVIQYGNIGVVTMVSAVKMAVELNNASSPEGQKWSWTDLRLSPGMGNYRIMPMGDSITYGVGGTRGGYRGRLFEALNARYSTPIFDSVGSVEDAQNGDFDGYPGYTIQGLLGVLQSTQTVAVNQPDMVLLMIGTNDLKTRTPVQIKADTLAVIEEIRAQKLDTRILLAKIPPWQYDLSYGNQHSAVNEILASGIPAVYLVDNCTGFHGLTGDGVHPNDEGYEWISEQWKAGISQVLGLPF